MRFLVDNAVSPKLVDALNVAGHEGIHVLNLGLADASDRTIMARAESEDRVVISADADFSTILAVDGRSKPSLVFLRGELPRRAVTLAQLLIERLPACEAALRQGAIVTISPNRTRIRDLPIRRH